MKGEYETDVSLYPDGTLSVRVWSVAMQPPHYSGKWKFGKDVLHFDIYGKQYDFKLKSIEDALWDFEINDKGFCLVVHTDSYVELKKLRSLY